jgi:distribution and morphology protein 31
MLATRSAIASGSAVRRLNPVIKVVPPHVSSRSLARSLNGSRYLAIHKYFTHQANLASSISLTRRYNSSGPTKPCAKCADATPSATAPPVATPPGHAQDYTPFILRLIRRSQSLTTNSPTRPTKDELLDAAGSWWERLRVRLKWFTIRGWRRFNADDYGALASVFVLGNSKPEAFSDRVWLIHDVAIWILIGT